MILDQASQAIIGHRRQLTILERLIKENRFPHAWIFQGPRHVGKTAIALGSARLLLNSDQANVLQHPDFIHTKLLDDASQISIRSVKDGLKQIQSTPLRSKRKVWVIEDADALSIEAQQALLKTIEEPVGDRVIFLVTTTDRLLPTVLSRCIRLLFSQIPSADLFSGLLDRGYPSLQAKELAGQYAGRPGLIFQHRNRSPQETSLRAALLNLVSLGTPDRFRHSKSILAALTALPNTVARDLLTQAALVWQDYSLTQAGRASRSKEMRPWIQRAALAESIPQLLTQQISMKSILDHWITL